MSSDNGLLLWHDGASYVVSDYNASRDYATNADMRRLSRHDDVASALLAAQEALRSGYEYGLLLEIDPELLSEGRDDSAPPAEASSPSGPRARPSDLAERGQ